MSTKPRRRYTTDAMRRAAPQPPPYRKPTPLEKTLCAARLCTVAPAEGRVMCQKHWDGLPEPLRTTIMEHFLAGHRAEYGHAVYEAVHFYDDQWFKPLFPRT